MKSLLSRLVFVLVVGACSLVPSNWGDRVPTIAPAAEASRPVVTSGPGVIVLRAISVRGAAVGKGYIYDMPHCGILSPIDVDGSFWDAVDVREDPVMFDGQPGTFTLIDAAHATFTTRDGVHAVNLLRHDGPKEFRLCG